MASGLRITQNVRKMAVKFMIMSSKVHLNTKMQNVSYYEIFRGVIRNDSCRNTPRTGDCMETFHNMYVHESWRNMKRFVECVETKKNMTQHSL